MQTNQELIVQPEYLFKKYMQEILDKYIAGKTYDELGLEYNYSREWARLIIKKLCNENGNNYNDIVKLHRENKKKLTVYTRYKHTCSNCNKQFENQIKNSKYCSRKCFGIVNIKHKELVQYKHDKKLYQAKRMKKYYHNVLKNNPDFKERSKVYNSNFLKKNPDYYKRQEVRERMNARYFEMKKDPVKYAEYLRKMRERRKRNKLAN